MPRVRDSKANPCPLYSALLPPYATWREGEGGEVSSETRALNWSHLRNEQPAAAPGPFLERAWLLQVSSNGLARLRRLNPGEPNEPFRKARAEEVFTKTARAASNTATG